MNTGRHYLTTFVRLCLAAVLLAGWLSVAVRPVHAQEGQVLGIHILQTEEITDAVKLLKPEDQQRDEWHYVTIPLTLNDLDKKDQWQAFFTEAEKNKIIPIVRLTTKFENGAWQVPSKRDIYDLTRFMNQLPWPTQDRYVIVFNEPNHAPEWGGQTNPAEYAQVLSFTADWLHTEQKNYKVLPAGLDLAAPNGPRTMEAFTYLDQMVAAEPDVLSKIDIWNSHSYPNPGFVSSPQRTGQNSLRGFQYELSYLKEKTGRDYDVFITETGWRAEGSTNRWLGSYYQYAQQHIWSDPRVKVVTPFILRGSPGPFAQFSFLDEAGRPTLQYNAFQELVKQDS